MLSRNIDRFFVVVLMTFSLSAGPVSATVVSGCDWYLSRAPVPTKAEEFNSRILGPFRSEHKVPIAQMKTFFERSIDFNVEYKRITGLSEFTFADLADHLKKAVFDAYYETFMNRFREASRLEVLRSEAIKRGLEGHGYKTDPKKTGQEELKELSRANVQRILEQLPFWREFAATVDTENIQSLPRLRFERNGRSKALGEFILSSQQLLEYSGYPGENSLQRFNRDELQSGDNIFFIAYPDKKHHNLEADLSMYGSHTFNISDQEYARAHGVITPFIMWPGDLEDLVRRLGWVDIKAPRVVTGITEVTLTAEQAAMLEGWRKKLYTLDFTVGDYQRLLTLHEMYTNFHIEKLRKTVTSDRLMRDINDFLDSYSLTRFGLNSLEMRIPVAAPVGIFEEMR